MKTLLSMMIMSISFSNYAAGNCRTTLEVTGNCLSPEVKERIIQELSGKGYQINVHEQDSKYQILMSIDSKGIEVGCSGFASIHDQSEEIVSVRGNNRLAGAALSIVTFGYSSVLPPTGKSVAKKLLRRLPDCQDL